MLFWSLGMWLFAICVLLEMLFAFGIYSQFLIKLYFLLVAVLVETLAMGSVALLRRKALNYIYAAYSIAITAFLLYALVSRGSLGNLIVSGVVTGALPVNVTIGSVLITSVGATLLIIIALFSFLKTLNLKLVSIILGVLVLSAGGALYIASFPSFLYISEFMGILLMWLGFVNLRGILPRRIPAEKNSVD